MVDDLDGLPPTPKCDVRVLGSQGCKTGGGSTTEGMPAEGMAMIFRKQAGEVADVGGVKGEKCRLWEKNSSQREMKGEAGRQIGVERPLEV